MKYKIFLILFVGILIGAAVTYFFIPMLGTSGGEATDKEAQLYSCGMHPEVISDEPGNCPICGMKLTPIKNTAHKAEQSSSSALEKESNILYWRAPMDATEIYEKPGKSKMGMDLVPVYAGEEGGGAGRITIDGTLQQNMNLRVAKVGRRDISNVIRVYGKVTYAEDKKYSVNTKINGWIEKLYVNTSGQKVQKGQPLMEIYSPELVSTQEEYLLALKNYEKLASSPYESMRINAKNLITLTRDRLDNWDISKSEIDNIKKTGKTRRTILLKSRVTGIVTHKNVVEGDKVSPGMDLFHIADLSKIWIEASVYESELPLIKVGQKAELGLDHLLGKKLEGKVDFIYPFLDQKSKANNIRLVFENSDLILKPDMYATVLIYSDAAIDSLAIPTEAVIHSGKRKIVFISKEKGEFEPREVTIGAESEDGYIQIISGLFEHEAVVVSGQFLLDSESQTREAIAKMRAAQIQKAQETSQHEEAAESHEITGHSHKASEKKTPKLDTDKLYACPMHPEFITTDPNAKCPDCGMNVVMVKEIEDKVDLEKAEFYTCPMHPDFLTTDKNASCPECGMKLEKVKKK